MTPENLLTEWSRLLFESLADAGLREVVVSPGSRSTPLAWAALSSTRLHATSLVDERSAGFFAVGHARMTGVPVALVCTSGSAAAHYFPAVVEAAMARVPLLVLTADRPFELMDCGASQTLDQTKLYGGYVRRFVELGMPDGAGSALAALRRTAAQAFSSAADGEPGPVHVNVRARKPLEPCAATSAEGKALSARVEACLTEPITVRPEARRVLPEAAIARVAASLAESERGLIVCGPASAAEGHEGSALGELARATGFPVYAETTSQRRFAGSGIPAGLAADGLDLLLRSPRYRDALRPNVVLQVGDAPTSGAWERFLASRPEIVRHVVAPHGWPDPTSVARTLLVADVGDTLSRLARAVGERAPGRTVGPWASAVSSASDAAFGVVDAVLAGEPALSEGSATRAVVQAVPADGILAVGNSLPVRHVDAFCRARPGGFRVWSQRGVSGIDGLVSGAAGAARALLRPTVLLVGDVSALHDLGGFAVAAESTVPLVIVVLNNDGGRIFETLPLASAGIPDELFRFWTTPHATRFEGLAALFRLRHRVPRTREELDTELGTALAHPGCSVLEIPVPTHGARGLYQAVLARLDEVVGPMASALSG